MKRVRAFQIELEFGRWFLRRGENRSTRRKTSRSKGENQQQTQHTYDVDARIRTRAELVGGECSHHCATRAFESFFCRDLFGQLNVAPYSNPLGINRFVSGISISFRACLHRGEGPQLGEVTRLSI